MTVPETQGLGAARRFALFLLIKVFDGVLHAPFNPFFPIYVKEHLNRPQVREQPPSPPPSVVGAAVARLS